MRPVHIVRQVQHTSSSHQNLLWRSLEYHTITMLPSAEYTHYSMVKREKHVPPKFTRKSEQSEGLIRMLLATVMTLYGLLKCSSKNARIICCGTLGELKLRTVIVESTATLKGEKEKAEYTIFVSLLCWINICVASCTFALQYFSALAVRHEIDIAAAVSGQAQPRVTHLHIFHR